MKKRDKYIKIHTKLFKQYQITSRLLKIGLLVIFVFLSTLIIFFARGYRYDFDKNTVSPTGIIAISSSPKTAKVFVNGTFKGVTDINLTLTPGIYDVEIKKDGFVPYKKTLTLKGEIVETIDPILFPINPSLSPITNLGISSAFPIGDYDKILLISETGDIDLDGIYVYESNNKPLNFFPPLKTIALKKNLPAYLQLNNVSVKFSPDGKQAILQFNQSTSNPLSYLVTLDGSQEQLFEVTQSQETLIQAWNLEKNKATTKILETFPKKIREIATTNFIDIRYSIDESKMLYRVNDNVSLPLVITPPLIAANQYPESRNLKKNHIYVYDRKEDKNYLVGSEKDNPEELLWYTDNKHLIKQENNEITILNYDGTNKESIYSGPFENNFLSVSNDGKLIIQANLNPLKNKLPDLYVVGIR